MDNVSLARKRNAKIRIVATIVLAISVIGFVISEHQIGVDSFAVRNGLPYTTVLSLPPGVVIYLISAFGLAWSLGWLLD